MQKATLTFLGFAAVLLVWALWFRPVALGGTASYAMVAGVSMEPTFHTGDLVIAHAQESYTVGDVIVFRVPAGFAEEGSLVVHRIIGGDAAAFVVQGDNKPGPDPWRPAASDIVGSSWVHIPGVGVFLLLLRTPLVLAATLGAFVAFWVFSSGGPREATGQGTAGSDRSAVEWGLEHDR